MGDEKGIEGYFREVANDFTSQLEKVKKFIRHPGTKGYWAELLLINFLRKYIPNHFAVSSGFIYGNEDNISPQIDILIHEASRYAPLLQFGDFVVVTTESAICAIEVKSKLYPKNFESELVNMKIVKEMVGNTSKPPPANLCQCHLFCFNSYSEEAVKDYIRKCPLEKLGYALDSVHSIHCGSKGTQFSIVLGNVGYSSNMRTPTEFTYYSFKKKGSPSYDIAFLVFYAILIDHLEMILGCCDPRFNSRVKSEGERGLLTKYLRDVAIIDNRNPIILGESGLQYSEDL